VGHDQRKRRYKQTFILEDLENTVTSMKDHKADGLDDQAQRKYGNLDRKQNNGLSTYSTL